MIGTALALGLGSSLIGGIGNVVSNMSASDRAAALQDKSLQEWLKVQIPDPAQQKLVLDKFVNEGKLDPKLEQSIKQDPSEFQKVTTSVGNRNAQNRALQELEGIGYNGGMRLQDKAALQDATLSNQARDRGNREAIAADMERRGLGGSGFQVAAQLSGQQGMSDQNSRAGLSVAAQAQDRALQSIQGAGDLASKTRAQDFSEQAQKAQAQDAINRFNTSNLQDVQARNVASQNAAQQYNLSNAQRLSEANTNQANQEQRYNKELLQQQFDNQAKVAAGKSGQYAQQAQNERNTGSMLGNAFSNIGQAGAGAASAQANRDYWTDYLEQQKNKNPQPLPIE